MAVFGAPIALEEHAFRACLAALASQEETNRVAGEVRCRDGKAVGDVLANIVVGEAAKRLVIEPAGHKPVVIA